MQTDQFQFQARITNFQINFPELYDNLLFLDNFEEPKDFFTMSKTSRLALKNTLKKISKQPTIDNCWIWFGSFSQPEFTPSYNRERVTRLMYKLFREGQLEVRKDDRVVRKRLILALTESRADVNPYKYHYGTGSRMKTKMEMLKSINNPVDTTSNSSLKIKIDAALLDISKYWNPGFNDTPESMTRFLDALGHDPDAIKAAIGQSDEFANPHKYTDGGTSFKE